MQRWASSAKCQGKRKTALYPTLKLNISALPRPSAYRRDAAGLEHREADCKPAEASTGAGLQEMWEKSLIAVPSGRHVPVKCPGK